VKVAAVRTLLGERARRVVPVDVDSGVSEQPFGPAETVTGARNRSVRALEGSEADLGVGIEGGVADPGASDDLYLTMWAAVTDGERTSVGAGPRIAQPPEVAERVRVGGNSLVIWTLDVLTAALVLQAFDVGLEATTLLSVCFFAVSVGNLAKVLPLSPGGIGLYEGAFTILVVGLTPVAAPVAFAASVVDHAVKNVVTLAGGVLSMLYLNVSLTTAVEQAADEDVVDGSGEEDAGTEPAVDD